LNAKIFAPDAALQTAPCPAISMLPGGGAEISSVEWAAQRLAANGYVVIITKPQSGASLNDYNAAARSGIDFLISNANPYLSSTDTDAVGAAGWSLGARVLSARKRKTRASRRLSRGTISPSAKPAIWFAAMHESADDFKNAARSRARSGFGHLQRRAHADAKKTAFNRWRQFGQPAMQVVFRGANHFWWSATAATQRNTTSPLLHAKLVRPLAERRFDGDGQTFIAFGE
jgi:hypothetical protein